MDTSRLAAGLERLPRPVRRGVERAHELVTTGRLAKPPSYVYEADGVATAHYSPFLEDREWTARYDRMARDWFVGGVVDVRWRMWILTEVARYADGTGAFAEFGTNRGGCAYMMLATTRHSPLHLFDTFSGIPDTNLTEDERAHGLAGMWSDASVEHVKQRLAEWPQRTHYVVGDVFDTLNDVETGSLSLVHMDLNAALPTKRALEYAHPRLRPGGVIVCDDYGDSGYEPQREVIDGFFAGTEDRPIALPTGQALVIKRP